MGAVEIDGGSIGADGATSTTPGVWVFAGGSADFSVTGKLDSVDSLEVGGMAATTAGVSGSVDGGSLSTQCSRRRIRPLVRKLR